MHASDIEKFLITVTSSLVTVLVSFGQQRVNEMLLARRSRETDPF